MGRYKLCGQKVSCKKKDGHTDACDFGIALPSATDEVTNLKQQIVSLTKELQAEKNKINKATPETLIARAATAELELARIHAAVREMVEGCKASGLTVLSAHLLGLVPELPAEPPIQTPIPDNLLNKPT